MFKYIFPKKLKIYCLDEKRERTFLLDNILKSDEKLPCLIYFCSKCGLFYYFSYSGKPQHNYDKLYENFLVIKEGINIYIYICYSVEKKINVFHL